ncbi:MAG TPA: hypothetical protein VJ019_06325, partial [Aestuariivirga sp.]|nr:hypothetical protein [Aestuariivirga sp.]
EIGERWKQIGGDVVHWRRDGTVSREFPRCHNQSCFRFQGLEIRSVFCHFRAIMNQEINLHGKKCRRKQMNVWGLEPEPPNQYEGARIAGESDDF